MTQTKEIQRWEASLILVPGLGPTGYEFLKKPNGNWIKYEDHIESRKQDAEMIQALRKALEVSQSHSRVLSEAYEAKAIGKIYAKANQDSRKDAIDRIISGDSATY